MTPYRFLWKSVEFQMCIAAASCAFWHAAVPITVHSEPSQIHYSLNTDKYQLVQVREGPTLSWGSRNRLTCLTLQEHDDDDDSTSQKVLDGTISICCWKYEVQTYTCQKMSLIVAKFARPISPFDQSVCYVKWTNRLAPCNRTWDGLSVATELPPITPSIDPGLIQALYRLEFPDLFGSCD